MVGEFKESRILTFDPRLEAIAIGIAFVWVGSSYHNNKELVYSMIMKASLPFLMVEVMDKLSLIKRVTLFIKNISLGVFGKF